MIYLKGRKYTIFQWKVYRVYSLGFKSLMGTKASGSFDRETLCIHREIDVQTRIGVASAT